MCVSRTTPVFRCPYWMRILRVVCVCVHFVRIRRQSSSKFVFSVIFFFVFFFRNKQVHTSVKWSMIFAWFSVWQNGDTIVTMSDKNGWRYQHEIKRERERESTTKYKKHKNFVKRPMADVRMRLPNPQWALRKTTPHRETQRDGSSFLPGIDVLYGIKGVVNIDDW